MMSAVFYLVPMFSLNTRLKYLKQYSTSQFDYWEASQNQHAHNSLDLHFSKPSPPVFSVSAVDTSIQPSVSNQKPKL